MYADVRQVIDVPSYVFTVVRDPRGAMANVIAVAIITVRIIMDTATKNTVYVGTAMGL